MSVLRVSSLGQCARRVVYSHSGVIPEVSPEAQRKMDLGKAIERLRVRELQAEGVRVRDRQREVRFGQSIGHLDGWLMTPDGPELFEIKSTSQYSIRHWTKESLPRSYSYQVHAYAAGLSDLLGEAVSRIRMDVVDRVSGECHTWRYAVEPGITHDAFQRANFLAVCLEKGNLPDREFVATSSECAYCPFRPTCRPNATPSNATQEVLDASGWEGWLEAVEVYLAGQQLKEEGEQLAAKAKDTILDGLVHHGATRAAVNGMTAVWSQVETSRLDAKALQKAHPEIHAQFVKPSTYTRLEIRK